MANACTSSCEGITGALIVSAVLGGIMAAVGAVAGQYIVPGMNAAQGAALLGFAGLMCLPAFGIGKIILSTCIGSVMNKCPAPSEDEEEATIKKIDNCITFFAVLGAFFASVAIASFILPEIGLKAISMSDAFTTGGAFLGIAWGLVTVVAVIDTCLEKSKKNNQMIFTH